jgi:hypothetical protein
MPEFLPAEVHRLRNLARREKGERLPPRPKRRDRPMCGQPTREGHPCKARAVWDRTRNAPLDGRCRIHSTDPEVRAGWERWRAEEERKRRERRAAKAEG